MIYYDIYCSTSDVMLTIDLQVDAGVEGTAHVDEGRETACGEALEPLHSGGRCVGDEMCEAGMVGMGTEGLGDGGELSGKVEA